MNNEHQHVIRIHISATTYTHSQSRHASRALRSTHIESVLFLVFVRSFFYRAPVPVLKMIKN